MRCFIALGLEDGPAEALRPWLDRTRAEFAELAVTPAANLHLTLAFLGEIDDAGVEAAADAVRAAAKGRAPWLLRWAAPGVFPSASRPRVLWLGVDGGKALIEVHGALTDALSGAQIPVEDRAFRPHLTLARLRRGAIGRERYREIVAHLDTLPEVAPSRAGSIVLFESRLGGGPAVHVPLLEARFGGPDRQSALIT
jgi:2'-5' RNA ligase